MKTIRREELSASGYVEDLQGLRDFQRRYVRPIFIFAVAFFGVLLVGAVAMMKGLSVRPYMILGGIICAAVSLGIAIVYACKPKSRRTGKPLQKYRNLSARPGYRETIYVDPDSKSYFSQVFGTPGA